MLKDKAGNILHCIFFIIVNKSQENAKLNELVHHLPLYPSPPVIATHPQ